MYAENVGHVEHVRKRWQIEIDLMAFSISHILHNMWWRMDAM